MSTWKKPGIDTASWNLLCWLERPSCAWHQPSGSCKFLPLTRWHVYTVLSTQGRQCYLLLTGVKVHCEMPLVITGFKNKGIRCGEGKLKGASPAHLNPNSSMRKFFFITFQMINWNREVRYFVQDQTATQWEAEFNSCYDPNLIFAFEATYQGNSNETGGGVRLRLNVLSKAQSLGFLWGIIQKTKPAPS